MPRLPARPTAAGPLAAGLLTAALLAPPAFAQDEVKPNPGPLGGDAADPALAEDAAELIPADAAVVIRVKDPDSAITHLQEFVAEAAPQYTRQTVALRGLRGLAIENAPQSGVDSRRPWYVVAVPRPDGPPTTVFLIPAANVQAMQEAVGPNFAFKTLGTYAAYTEKKDGAGETALEGFGPGGGFVGLLPDGSEELAEDSDITLAVNVPRILEVYGDFLKARLDELKERMAAQAGDSEQAATQTRGLEFLTQVAKDSGVTVVGFSADADKLAFKKISAVKSGTKTAEFLAAQTPAAFDVLGKLPEGLDGYIAAEGDFAPLAEAAKDFLPQDGDAKGRYETLLTAMTKAGLRAAAGGFEFNADGPLVSGVQVTQVKDAAAARSAIGEYLKGSDGQTMNGLTMNVEDAGEVEVGGVALRKFITSYESDGTPEGDAAVRGTALIAGPDGQEVLTGAAEGAIVQVTGGDDAFAAEAVAHLKGGTGHKNAQLDMVRGMLPKSGNLFAAADVAAVAQAVLAKLAETGLVPIPLDPEQINDVAIESSYAAIVLTTDADGVTVEGVLPAGQVRNLVDFGTAMQETLGGPQGF